MGTSMGIAMVKLRGHIGSKVIATTVSIMAEHAECHM